MKLENPIGWCDVTANPVIGCRGCELGDHCYAKHDTPARVLRAGGWPGYHGRKVETFGPGSDRVPVAGFAKWVAALNRLCVCDTCHETQALPIGDCQLPIGKVCGRLPNREKIDTAALSRDAATELLADHECTGRLRRIRLFADSNSDWLDWPTDVLAGALDAIRQADNLDVILCTKWPELFAEKIKAAWWKAEGLAADDEGDSEDLPATDLGNWLHDWLSGIGVPQNLILLTSITSEKTLRRADDLLKIPARVHGLSCEPLWESVMLPIGNRQSEIGNSIGWVIVGGESGKGRFPCGWDAIANVADQCVTAGVSVYVKQDSTLKPGQQGSIPDSYWKLKNFPTQRDAGPIFKAKA